MPYHIQLRHIEVYRGVVDTGSVQKLLGSGDEHKHGQAQEAKESHELPHKHLRKRFLVHYFIECTVKIKQQKNTFVHMNTK